MIFLLAVMLTSIRTFSQSRFRLESAGTGGMIGYRIDCRLTSPLRKSPFLVQFYWAVARSLPNAS
ncbi:hypothetical protein Poly41_56990 [Novipirellula artificiosorum]|uniref:Uncharacterized protein n=1 Tax=Novipirellula artificiosorum TaxID=2528016 RepID=A0A5C6D8U8_9BACT|nr:hypothetical protein Poly41_56990 [Novipirellula artificiosorum]